MAQHFEFYQEKYDTKILIDIGRIELLEHMIRTPEPHTLGFYDVALITSGTGTFKLDDYSIPIHLTSQGSFPLCSKSRLESFVKD